MQKTMYGLRRTLVLFYRKLVEDLEAFDFELNPYDPCVTNKMVKGEQMMLTRHVNNLKVLHKDPLELAKFILYLARIYGNQIKVNQGVHHHYLGMDLDYLLPQKVQLSMIKYVDKVLEDFPEAITRTSYADHLFQIRDPEEVERNGKFLSKEHANARHFHHTIAPLLFVSSRAQGIHRYLIYS
eukprot:CCRYP_002683-RA/>CCRYP_002683-RA protein AED:0.40 eAED:0.41 QI:0/0/0/1/0/0/2/0/182